MFKAFYGTCLRAIVICHMKTHTVLAAQVNALCFNRSLLPVFYHALLPVSYLQFHGITYPLVLVLFVSLP